MHFPNQDLESPKLLKIENRENKKKKTKTKSKT